MGMARQLTDEELTALREYAEKHGRNWKAALREAWMTASEPGILQRLRNDITFGPKGLIAFRFKKDREVVPESAMRLTFVHFLCGDDVEGVQRWVITEPNDPSWPANVQIRVPYCPTCKRLVTVGELRNGPRT